MLLLDFHRIRYPALDPLFHVQHRQLRLEKAVPDREYLFELGYNGNFASFKPHASLFPGGSWGYESERPLRAVHDALSGLDLGVQPHEYVVNNKVAVMRNRVRHNYEFELTVSPYLRVDNTKIKAVWTYECLVDISKQEKHPRHLLWRWSRYVDAFRKFQESENRDLLLSWFDERYAQLRSVVPGLPPCTKTAHAAVYDEIAAIVAISLPERQRDEFALVTGELRRECVRERIEITFHFLGKEPSHVDLKLATSTGPKEQSRRGEMFLSGLIGSVPALARDNTHGKDRYAKLEPSEVYFVQTRERCKRFLDAAACLRNYVEVLQALERPLAEMEAPFRETGWTSALLVQAE